jgi:hypothetical protein
MKPFFNEVPKIQPTFEILENRKRVKFKVADRRTASSIGG